MSLRRVRSRAGFSSWLLACCRRKLKISCRKSRLFAASSVSVMSLSSDIFIKVDFRSTHVVARNELGLDGQLGSSQPHRLTSDRFGDAIDLEQNVGGTNHRHPRFKRAFALAHSSFERLLGKGLLREDPDPDLAAALHEAGNGDAGGFDLLGIHPATFHRLQ